MNSKQRRFPIHIGVIMLPLLLASTVGVIVFSFNIFFTNTAQAVINLPVSHRNINAQTDTAQGSPVPVVSAVVDPVNRNNDTPIEADPVLPVLARTETERINNTGLAVPVGGIRAQRLEGERTESASNETRASNEVRPAAAQGQANVARPAATQGQANVARTAATQGQANVARTEPARGAQDWLIQAGAFSIESSAVQIKNRITQLGYDARVARIEADRPLFRVMVSPGNSRDAPNDALRRLHSVGIEGYIIRRRP